MKQTTWIDGWIANIWGICGAVMLWLAVLVGGYLWVFPWLGDKLAAQIPASIERQIGEQALKQLGHSKGYSDKLKRERIQEIIAQMQACWPEDADTSQNTKIDFHIHRGQVNALALPGNIIVLYEELILGLDNDAVLAVIAHEMGHLKLRHGMRRVISMTLVNTLVQSVNGQNQAAGQMTGFLAQAFLNSAYSREMERAADDHAVELLRQCHLDAQPFVRAMQLFEKIQKEKTIQSGTWISTHPATAERRARYENK